MVDYQLSQIAILHHLNGLSQQEIANLLNLSKMTVSRMLQKAKEHEIVRTEVKLPFNINENLENDLQKKFRIFRARVIEIKAEDEDQVRDELARAAAFYFNTTLPSNSIIGIGIGKTIGQTIKHICEMKSDNVHIIQLMGGLPDVTRENPFSIIQESCRKLDAKGTFLTSFAAAENFEVREQFMKRSDTGRLAYELWEKCNLAVFGVGSLEHGTILSPKLVNSTEMDELRELNVIGDILGHCFTDKGELVNASLESRLVSIPLSLLNDIEERRAIAFGTLKVSAISGALRTGLITELITDNKTAEKLLEIEDGF